MKVVADVSALYPLVAVVCWSLAALAVLALLVAEGRRTARERVDRHP